MENNYFWVEIELKQKERFMLKCFKMRVSIFETKEEGNKLFVKIKAEDFKKMKHIWFVKIKKKDVTGVLKLKNQKSIFLNDISVSINTKIIENDVLKIVENFEEDSSNILSNPNISLNILFEDEFLLIVDKPAGIPVHPSILHYEDSLSNGVKYYFEKIGLKKKIRPVNRLDKDTSGLVIFAKNEYIQENLIYQMKTKEFQKEYLAIIDGCFLEDSGTINAPISRKLNSIIEREINFENGQTAITHFKTIKKYTNYSLVNFILETGRTHQIRVHSKFKSHPLLGDSLYGTKSNNINRQALHAYKLSFIHPISKSKIVLEVDLPDDMKKLLY